MIYHKPTQVMVALLFCELQLYKKNSTSLKYCKWLITYVIREIIAENLFPPRIDLIR
jgi:hypothetical protein